MTILRQIGKRNQLTIPAKLLRASGVRPGDYVELANDHDKIIILPKLIEDKDLSKEE